MSRPNFSLKTMLWLMTVVAAFLGGAGWQYRTLNHRMVEMEAKHSKMVGGLEDNILRLQLAVATAEAKAAAAKD